MTSSRRPGHGQGRAVPGAGVGGAEPARAVGHDEAVVGQLVVAEVALGEGRPAEPHLVVLDAHGRRADRHAVVDAAAARLARPVAADDPDAVVGRAREQRRRGGLAADEDAVEAAEGVDRAAASSSSVASCAGTSEV